MLRLWLAHDPLARSIAANVSSHPNSQAVASSPAPSSDRSGRDYPLPTTRYSLLLISYFRSGWAFLIPYLAAYLLYAWLRWPVNPATDLVPSVPPSSVLRPPCLLHAYWALHAIHVVLGAIALRSWWRQTSPLPSPLSLLLKAAPWICLMLLFYIPGIYLEWPSDPWEHLRRINEWHILDNVTAHSTWKKSSYFLPYSLTGHTTGLVQLSWLNVYYTTVCLLLSWQYYRLARAVGLGERASFVFVLLNAVTFGNNIFSFYRYYGLSSSFFAQIGAIALTHLAVESARGNLVKGIRVKATQPFSSVLPFPRIFLPQCASGIALFALTAFNHLQGLGIAALGMAAVAIWRLNAWRRCSIYYIAAGFIALSTICLWLAPESGLIARYRNEGWLNALYGFALQSPDSPASGRYLQIVGTIGMASLVAAAFLLRRNHVAGWLTVVPTLALFSPAIAIPFAHFVGANGVTENIATFHRMLMAMPLSLAIVVVYVLFLNSTAVVPTRRSSQHLLAILALPCALAAATLLPPSNPSYSRFWNALAVVPDSLALKQSWPTAIMHSNEAQGSNRLLIVRPPHLESLRTAAGMAQMLHNFRRLHDGNLAELRTMVAALDADLPIAAPPTLQGSPPPNLAYRLPISGAVWTSGDGLL